MGIEASLAARKLDPASLRLVSSWFRSYGFADVLDGLLIGAYPLDRDDVGMLEWVGIERVLNLVEDGEYPEGDRDAVETALAEAGIEERRIGMTDYGNLPSEALERAVAEVVASLEEGKRTYLHCRAGWQRSAAVAAGVVAIQEGVDVEEALALVKARKPSADPLPHQREDLRRWWDERIARTAPGLEESGGASPPPAADER
jgi:protein-tyrosine phosphatase